MSSAILGDVKQSLVGGGPGGRKYQWGQAAFVTTGLTLTIPTNMTVVESVIFFPAKAYAADEIVYWSDVGSGTQGQIPVPSSGNITLTRAAASPTSGLYGSYLIIGY
jgi:hypothetical protein